MARFTIEDAGNYGGGSSNFFSLKNDKDTANVRILLNDINDLYGVSCHEVDEHGNKYDVECLRDFRDPIDKCPLCAAKYKLNAKVFIPLYDEDSGTTKIWSRGKTYFEILNDFCIRYSPLVSTPFEIVRHGQKGDFNTTYSLYPGKQDNAKLSDYPTVDIENVAFQVKTYDEMQNFLKTGSFSSTNAPSRDRDSSRQIPIRRTPARSEEDNY